MTQREDATLDDMIEASLELHMIILQLRQRKRDRSFIVEQG